MPGRLRVPPGMAVRRAIAAKRQTAFLTGLKVNPMRADHHALGAFANFGLFDRSDRLKMRAGAIGHAVRARQPAMAVGGGGTPTAMIMM